MSNINTLFVCDACIGGVLGFDIVKIGDKFGPDVKCAVCRKKRPCGVYRLTAKKRKET